jgi:hypothetical protein
MFYKCSDMIQHAASAEPDALPDAAAWELESLRELGDLCMRLARVSAARAEEALAADADALKPRGGIDPALAFTRFARAVRMTVGLHARIRKDREAQVERKSAEQALREVEAAEALEDRRRTGNLRRAMTRFIAQTAIEAEEREAPDVERLFADLDARLDHGRPDALDFEHVDVKALAWALCQDLGVDPGPDWWFEGWGVEAPPQPAQAAGP